MSVGGIAPTLAASLQFAGGSAGASTNGNTGAAEIGSVGPAAVLSLSGAGGASPLVQTVSQLWTQELRQGTIDLLA